MKNWIAVMMALAAVAAGAEEKRWVYLPCNFWGKAGEVHSLEFFEKIVDRAAETGYNGVVLSAHFDLSWRWPAHLSNQVIRAKAHCDRRNIELVPMLWDVGYGGDCSGNWFEGRTVEDMEYTVLDGRAVFDPEKVVVSMGGGTKPREGSERGVKVYEGEKGKSMPMRPNCRFRLKAGRHYCAKLRARAVGVPEKDRFQFIGFIPSVKGKSAYYGAPKFVHDGEWQDIVWRFEARSDEEVTLVFGFWGNEGRFETEKLEICECGIVGAIRREGVDFIVRDESGKTVYEEGRDYENVPPIAVRGEGDPTGPWLELRVPKGSRIVKGARLRVTADTPDRFRTGGHDQYAACMSNGEWYRRAEKAAAAVKELVAPKDWFLCFDELRSANICSACRKRGLNMAEMIADCLKKQCDIVEKVTPGATCYVWGDMLDPNHNANEGYAHTRGSYEGIAKIIPKELVIVPWYGERAAVITEYWRANGFKVLPGGYYDAKDFTRDLVWKKGAERHPEMFAGFMFCTWRNDFSKLGEYFRVMTGKTP